jgi:hypothetical protein
MDAESDVPVPSPSVGLPSRRQLVGLRPPAELIPSVEPRRVMTEETDIPTPAELWASAESMAARERVQTKKPRRTDK